MEVDEKWLSMDANRNHGEFAQKARAALSTVESNPGVAKPDPILTADGIRRNFGGVVRSM